MQEFLFLRECCLYNLCAMCNVSGQGKAEQGRIGAKSNGRARGRKGKGNEIDS